MIESCHTQKTTTTTDPLKVQQSHKQSSPSSLPTPNYSSQIQGLQEEILHLRAQISLLQSELSSYTPKYNEQANEDEEYIEYEEAEGEEIQEGNENIKTSIISKKTEDNENDKSIYNSEDQCETLEIEALQLQQPTEFTKITTAKFQKTNNVVCSPSKHSHTSRPVILGNSYKTSNTFEQPIAKIAERVKLKRTMEDNFIAGNELTSSGVSILFCR